MPQVSENHIYGGYSFRNNARTVAEIEILRVKTRLYYLLMWRTKVLCLLWEVKNSLCTPGNHKPKWPLAEGVRSLHIPGSPGCPSQEPLHGRVANGHQEASGYPGFHPCLALPTWTHLGFNKIAKFIFYTSLPFLNHLFCLQELPRHRISNWCSPVVSALEDSLRVVFLCLPPTTHRSKETGMREGCVSGAQHGCGSHTFPQVLYLTCR